MARLDTNPLTSLARERLAAKHLLVISSTPLLNGNDSLLHLLATSSTTGTSFSRDTHTADRPPNPPTMMQAILRQETTYHMRPLPDQPPRLRCEAPALAVMMTPSTPSSPRPSRDPSPTSRPYVRLLPNTVPTPTIQPRQKRQRNKCRLRRPFRSPSWKSRPPSCSPTQRVMTLR